MKGYKYRDIECFERDFETLLRNQIYAPPFIDLNDPFEGMCNEEITHLAKILGKTFNVDTTEVIESLEKIEDFKNILGIYSLSATFSDELMWAHYANSHKGFCLEYETTKLKDKYLAPEMVTELEVDYKPEPQTLTYLDIKEKNKILKKLFTTKSLKWSYEQEVRLIFDSFELKDYHPSALTGIYFGTRFSQEKKQQLINSLTNRDIRFYEMYMEDNSYILRRRLVHENKRIIQKKLNPEIYEILSTNHYPKAENFNVFYKGEKIDKESLNYFFDSFRENFATKDCNIKLFNDKSIIPLIDKYPLSKSEYIKVADHFIALSSFEMPSDFSWYPYQDFQYKEYSGNNWKKEEIK